MINVNVFRSMLGVALFAGLSEHTIVLPSDGVSSSETFVINDFNELLSRSIGNRLPIVTDELAPKNCRIFVKRAPSWFDYSQLIGRDAAVVCKDGDVWLFGRGPNGVRYAVYDFLTTDLGYRFFDARGGMRIPDVSSWHVTNFERIVRFSFPGRKVSMSCMSGKEAAMFYFRTGLNCNLESFFKREGFPKGVVIDDFIVPWPYCHGLMEHFPRNRAAANLEWVKPFASDYDKEMPECFSLGKDGKRNADHQPCLSNAEVRRVIRRNYFNFVARQERPAYLDLSACDTPGRFCWCERCRATEEKYGTPGGPLIDLLLSYSHELAERYPDQKMLMLAYRKCQTEIPPKGFKRLPDNLVPDFAPIDDDFSKSWLHPHNAGTLRNLREWGRLCKDVLLWYYPNPYGELVVPPIGNVRRLATDMHLMYETGNVSLFFEHNVGVREMTGFSELQSYLIARLSRNISLDVSSLIDEFLAFEYGDAAVSVRQYLDQLEDVTKECQRHFPWNAGMRDCDFLTPNRLKRWQSAFDQAEKSVGSDRVRLRNLRRLRLGLDIATLKIAKDVSVMERIRSILGEISKDCFSDAHTDEGRSFAKKLLAQLRLYEMQFGPNAKPLPENLFGHVPPENITVAMPLSTYGGMVDDVNAAYGIAAVLDSRKGGSASKAMKLPFVANVETYLPRSSWMPAVGEGVTVEKLGPRDAYKFYFMGCTTLTRDLHVEFGSWGLRSRDVSNAFQDGAFNRARIFASLKFQGPAFYPDDKRPDCVYCDRVVVVRDFDGAVNCQ